MIRWRVELHDARAHLWRVTLTLARPAARQGLQMPVWTPGSYTLRDFARHVSGMTARQGRRTLVLEREGTSRWVALCEGSAALVVTYFVYGFDESIRGTFLDGSRGFINGPALFVQPEGREAEPQQLEFGALPRGWQIATAMRPAGPRRYEADDHGELIDHPFVLGRLRRSGFAVAGCGFELVVEGAWDNVDHERLAADTRRLCETAVRFWHGRGKPPFARYAVLLHASDAGAGGGLEHRASCMLAAARRDLPRIGQGEPTDGHAGLLTLIAHEVFHAWNVKRLKPREHAALRLDREQPTELLWFFEGFTEYYGELLPLRAGLIDRARWLKGLARWINAVHAMPGRRVQSVAQASWDAWIKYYKRDENTANATVSYYDAGALVALLTDLSLRRHGRSLDEAMRALWQRAAAGPVGEDDILAAVGKPVAADLRRWVHGTGELPLAEHLAAAGLKLRDEPVSLAARLGLRLSEGPVSGVQVRSVLRGSAAEAAGLAAGDELLAADGWRIRRLDEALQWTVPAQPFTLLAVRDQRVIELRVRPPAQPAAPSFSVVPDDAAAPAARALRKAWLGD